MIITCPVTLRSMLLGHKRWIHIESIQLLLPQPTLYRQCSNGRGEQFRIWYNITSSTESRGHHRIRGRLHTEARVLIVLNKTQLNIINKPCKLNTLKTKHCNSSCNAYIPRKEFKQCARLLRRYHQQWRRLSTRKCYMPNVFLGIQSHPQWYWMGWLLPGLCFTLLDMSFVIYSSAQTI